MLHHDWYKPCFNGCWLISPCDTPSEVVFSFPFCFSVISSLSFQNFSQKPIRTLPQQNRTEQNNEQKVNMSTITSVPISHWRLRTAASSKTLIAMLAVTWMVVSLSTVVCMVTVPDTCWPSVSSGSRLKSFIHVYERTLNWWMCRLGYDSVLWWLSGIHEHYVCSDVLQLSGLQPYQPA